MTRIEVSETTNEMIQELQDEIEVKATVADDASDYTVPLDDEVSKDQVVEISVTLVRHLLRKERQMESSVLDELDEEMASTLNDRDIKHDM